MVGGGKDREEMRLIDADDFKKFLQALCKAGAPYEGVVQLLDKQPTAFDTEKVVEKLMIIHDEGYCPSEDSLECVLNNSCSDCYREKIADIVKKGGVE